MNFQTCPSCSAAVWDNRPKKASGEYKATSPDFKCQANCGWVKWLTPKGAPAKPASKPAQAATPVVAPVQVAQRPVRALNWRRLEADYAAAVLATVKGLTAGLGCQANDLDQQAVQAGAATLLIQATKGGYELPAAPAPKEPLKPAPHALDDLPDTLEEDDDLQF